MRDIFTGSTLGVYITVLSASYRVYNNTITVVGI